MRQVGSPSHKDIFETDNHIISSFWIHVESSNNQPEYPFKDRLKLNNIEYEEIEDLGGHRLKFTDPSGNKFSIHAEHGIIK